MSEARALAPDERERVAWVALSRLAEPGTRSVAAAATSGAAALLDRVLGKADDSLSQTLRARREKGVDPWDRAAADLAAAARAGARIVTPVDAEWPAPALSGLSQLAELEGLNIAPPFCLWLRGPVGLTAIAERSVAIVGARAATGYGGHVAGELGYGLADRGWGIVSGGALGIDGAAHRGALAADGVTMAVLAGGIDVPYPLAHAALLDRIGGEGLVISEVPPGEAPQRHRFLLRNRLVAALSSGLVVVEAGQRSGTTVTAERAHQLGRRLMAVPGPVTSALSFGTHRLVRDLGATLVTCASDVLDAVAPVGEGLTDEVPVLLAPASGTPAGESGPDRATLSRELLAVLEAVPAGVVVTVEEVAQAARLPPTQVRRALPSLAVRGFVRSVAGGYRLTAAGQGPASHRDGTRPWSS
jgi:DNA processing protein